MAKVALVTDSTTYLPKAYMDKYGIREVPVTIIWSGKSYRDGVDMQADDFYKRLSIASEMPGTSQPTPSAVKEVFEEELAKGFDILAVFISEKLSGTYASGIQAQAMLPGKKIEVIDSHSGSMGAGWPILSAARAAAEGADLGECKHIVQTALDYVDILLMVDTLEFLQRGGRIGRAQRFLGSALNLKPLLQVSDGEFLPLEQVRTRRKAFLRLLELLEKHIGGRSPVHLAVLHANALDRAQELLDLATARVNPMETLISEVSPAVGAHLGPGTVGFAFMAGI